MTSDLAAFLYPGPAAWHSLQDASFFKPLIDHHDEIVDDLSFCIFPFSLHILYAVGGGCNDAKSKKQQSTKWPKCEGKY